MKRLLVVLGICVLIVLIFQISYYYEYFNIHFIKSLRTSNDIINEYRQKMNNELEDFQFPDDRQLSSFVPELNGSAVQILIITTWRSGSTFLGDLISSIPGMFYHYEPLTYYGAVRIRNPPKSKRTVRNIKSFFQCDYYELPDYIKLMETYIYPMKYNKRLWTYCKENKTLCSDSTFLSQFCSLFPFHSMKVLRMSLKSTEELLSDNNLNIKVIFLVRDPRGTINSRNGQKWCIGDCAISSLLCTDLVSDYNAAVLFKSLYPDKFRVIRYEELALDPYGTAEKLFKFFGLYMHKDVNFFLNSHTKISNKNPLSTFRISAKAPFHWREELNFTEVRSIENECSLPMKLWGYVPVKDEISMPYFPPLTDYTLD